MPAEDPRHVVTRTALSTSRVEQQHDGLGGDPLAPSQISETLSRRRLHVDLVLGYLQQLGNLPPDLVTHGSDLGCLCKHSDISIPHAQLANEQHIHHRSNE